MKKHAQRDRLEEGVACCYHSEPSSICSARLNLFVELRTDGASSEV